MAINPNLLRGLREHICAFLEGQPSDQHVDGLVRTCHALAVAALRSKRTNRLLLVDNSLDLSDLAYDCIAELFRRDDRNTYVRISVYFNSFDLESLPDEDLLASLRRLVCSSVNQGLFRVYGDLDPSLGKILRNIKVAVHALGTLNEVERLGEQCVVPAVGDRLDHLPVIELEELQTELALCATGHERIPDIMAALSKYLCRQKKFTRVVPLVRLGLAIRWLYSIKQLPPPPVPEPDSRLHSDDARQAVLWACRKTWREIGARYLDRGKISEDLFGKYRTSIELYLLRKLDGEGDPVTLFESLRSVIPDLNKEEFRRKHKTRLEYLARQAEDLALGRLASS